MRIATTLIALCWIAAVISFGWSDLPQLPLDVSATDPATLDALNAARIKHAVTFAALAILPAALLVWAGRRLTAKAKTFRN